MFKTYVVTAYTKINPQMVFRSWKKPNHGLNTVATGKDKRTIIILQPGTFENNLVKGYASRTGLVKLVKK